MTKKLKIAFRVLNNSATAQALAPFRWEPQKRDPSHRDYLIMPNKHPEIILWDTQHHEIKDSFSNLNALFIRQFKQDFKYRGSQNSQFSLTVEEETVRYINKINSHTIKLNEKKNTNVCDWF